MDSEPFAVWIDHRRRRAPMKAVCLGLIRVYRLCVSPFLGRACRFEPTCSAYAYDAIVKYGALRGIGMACFRLLKCHPFHPGGMDPVK
jgi:putative membrane protein insertion efficiency factor